MTTAFIKFNTERGTAVTVPVGRIQLARLPNDCRVYVIGRDERAYYVSDDEFAKIESMLRNKVPDTIVLSTSEDCS